MWFSFGRRKREAKGTRKRRPYDTTPTGTPSRAPRQRLDPIKNWEPPEQQFLRQAGDPFIDG